MSVKKYGEDVAIVEENPKIEKIYDNNLRQGEEIVIKKGTPTTKISTDSLLLKRKKLSKKALQQ